MVVSRDPTKESGDAKRGARTLVRTVAWSAVAWIASGCVLPEYSTNQGVDCAILRHNDQCDEPLCPGDPQCAPVAERSATVPMDASCWVDGTSNRGEIQGNWYGYADGIAMTIPDPFCPFRAGENAMCLVGETIEDVAAWGGGIGFDLNYPDGGQGPESKLPYDAAARGIVGFRLTVVGSVPQGLRVNFTMVPLPNDAQPFVELEGPGTHEVFLADAAVPTTWDTPNAGSRVNPAEIYSVEVQAVGGFLASPFDYCVTSIEPIWQ